MSRPAGRSSLKRQVSPAAAIVTIVVVIGLLLAVGLVGVPWLTRPRPDTLAAGLPQGAVKQVLGERLGAVVMPRLSEKGMDGLHVTQVSAGTEGGLQVGDLITSVNGRKTADATMAALVRAMDSVRVGATMPVAVTRGGATTTIQVTRRESTSIEELRRRGASAGVMPGMPMQSRGPR